MADAKATAATHKAAGNAALAAKDFPEAIRCYTLAIQADPSDHVFFSNRSAAYMSMENFEEALGDAERCVALKPDWSKGYGRKGAALHALKRFDEAAHAYRDGLKQEPGSTALEAGLQAVQKAKEAEEAEANPLTGSSGPFGASMWTRLAANPKTAGFLQDPKVVQALKMIQMNPSALSSSSMMSDPRIMQCISALLGIPMDLGADDSGFGSPPAASASSASSGHAAASSSPSAPAPEPELEPEDLSPEELELRNRKREAAKVKADANAAYKARDFEAALTGYDRCIELDPDDITYRTNKAAVYFEQGDLEASIRECEAAIEHGRAVRAPFQLLGKAYARIGSAHAKAERYDLAIEAYKSSLLESSSRDVETKLKQVQKAKKKADEEAYINPALGEEAKNRGNVAFKEGRFGDAIREYDEAIKRHPQNAVYYANRAAARTMLLDVPAGIDDAEKAIALDPSYVRAYARLGALQCLAKEFHKALDTYRTGLSIDESNEECRQGLMHTQLKIQELSSSGSVDKERAQRALADPEIQEILRDPMVQSAIQDLQRPGGAASVLSDESMMRKLEKLIAAGVLQIGGSPAQ